MESPQQLTQWVGNVFSAGAIISTVLGWAPAIAAIVALCWYLIQIFESDTVRRWVSDRRIRKIARLKARVILMEAQMRRPLPGPGGDV